MKKIFIYSVIGLLFACQSLSSEEDGGNAQSGAAADTSAASNLKKQSGKGGEAKENLPAEETWIADIRKQFAEVNVELPNYQKVQKELMESAEGGQLTGYYEQGSLRKMVVANYGEMGREVKEYFFLDDRLFFVFEQEARYNAPMYTEGYKVESVREQRYYFHEGNLIRWLDGKTEVPPLKFPERDAEVMDETTHFRNILEKE